MGPYTELCVANNVVLGLFVSDGGFLDRKTPPTQVGSCPPLKKISNFVRFHFMSMRPENELVLFCCISNALNVFCSSYTTAMLFNIKYLVDYRKICLRCKLIESIVSKRVFEHII